MKNILLLISALFISAPSFSQTLDRSVRPKPGPAPEVKLGEAQSFTLPNGLKVFVVENNKLPRIATSLQFDIDPALQGSMAGYHDMVGEMMSAGTKTRTKDQFNKEVDMLGANVSASSGGAYASGLKRHADKIFDLLSDMVINPVFPASELEKLKTQTLSGLKANQEDANAIADNISSVVNYGKGHPYSEITTEKSVEAINLEAFKKYHSTYYRPNVAYMAIVGNISLAEAKTLVGKYFSNWQKGEVPKAVYPKVTKPSENKVFLANKEGAVQSVINVTYPVELKRNSEDVIKARLLNQILGGGSLGRLFLDLREKHGWTYGAYSDLQADEIAASFTAGAQARNPVTDSSVAAILENMNRLRTEPISEEELQANKTLMGGKFAMSLENPQTIAGFAINTERYKLPKDFYKNYLKNIAAITAPDLMKTAQKYLATNNANIVVVGNIDEVEKSLERFGKVDVRDMYGNPVVRTAKVAAPAGMTGDQVYKKYVDAIGGPAAISKLKDLKVVREAEIQGQKLTITTVQKSPKMYLQTVGMGPMVMQKKVVTGNAGYEEQQGQKNDLSAEDLADAIAEGDLQKELNAEKYGEKRTLKSQDGNLYVVEMLDAKGEKSTEYYDATTGFLVKQTQLEEGPNGKMPVTTELMDYKEVPGTNGYKIPYMIKVPIGPGMTLDAQVVSVEVNKGIEDSIFK